MQFENKIYEDLSEFAVYIPPDKVGWWNSLLQEVESLENEVIDISERLEETEEKLKPYEYEEEQRKKLSQCKI